MRTLLVLANGPGADRTYDQQRMEIGVRGVPVSVARTVWSSCVEAALEYVRILHDVRARGAHSPRSNIMLAAAGGPSEAALAFRWGDEQQSAAASTAALYKAIEVNNNSNMRLVDASRAAADAARLLVQGLPRRKPAGACRAMFIINPETVGGVAETAGELERVMAATFRSELQALGFGDGAAGDFVLDCIWVVGKDQAGGRGDALGGREGAGGGGLGGDCGAVEAGKLRARICRLVAVHHQLQPVRIMGIPMKDSGAAAGDGGEVAGERQDKKEYSVELLSRSGARAAQELVLEWKKNKDLERAGVFIHSFASMSIRYQCVVVSENGLMPCTFSSVCIGSGRADACAQPHARAVW